LITQSLRVLFAKKLVIFEIVIFLSVWVGLPEFGLINPLSIVFAADSRSESVTSAEVSSNNNEFNSNEEESFEFDEDWDDDFDEGAEGSSSPSDFTWRIEVAFENFINTRRELHSQDAYKKDEISASLELRYGASDDYLFSLTDFSFFPTFINDTVGDDYSYSEKTKTYRNLRISSSSSEIIFREFYYNWSREKYRIRIGNQLYPWGTADFLNATAYFNPSDLRELLFKDEDKVKLGVPSLSGMFFFDGFTAEAVFVPVHTAEAFPITGDFWSVKMAEDSYPLIFGDSDPMEANSKNFGYGGRIASTYEGMDFSLSGYHGPDAEAVIVPAGTVLIENQTVSVLVQPSHFIVDYIGFDFAWTYEDFVFQAETAYSPNKSGFIKQDTDRPEDLTFPYDTKKTEYLAYSLGFNYFIPLQKLISGHAGESLFTVEWYQAQYFDDDINRPQITDFLTCRFQDTYFDDRVSLSLTSIFETRCGGVVVWPKVGYDFQNGFKVELGYVGIKGHGEGDYEKDSIFYYYKDNDLIMVNFLYAYP